MLASELYNIYNSRNFVLVLNNIAENGFWHIYNSRNFVLVLNALIDTTTHTHLQQ